MKSVRLGFTTLISSCAIGTICLSQAAIAAPKVVASIAPIHSITAAIMDGIAEPDLLVELTGSPHSTQLRPSQVSELQEADLIVWIGPNLEAFLDKPIDTLPKSAHVLTLTDAAGLKFLPVREGGNWERHEHDHEGEDHDAHEDHDHDDDHQHGEHEHEHGDDHEGHGDHHDDPHVWLDPINAIEMAHAITAELTELDPDNGSAYASNEKAFVEKLNSVIDEATTSLEGLSDKPYFVFHDAYQYFEHRFGTNATGSVTLHPGVNPGAARVREIHQKLSDANAVCLFSEPQFSPKILSVLAEGTAAGISQLDPIGANLEPGPDLYPNLIRYNANQLSKCLREH
ncbi:zinc ABC transporter substrate-binding protein ZnuA [uncultured Cohaesibacter sp.]|uniref:zinc ABC transporter substrate-binding protein ZnuA n=1 Tax=uncultured Cohaesibacter sp. TaxID=1002546 RepID=UPI0029C861B5|nr:zinc ABC transporter substrate-binding protein ZnuA [uncultured Cohaesibacter sp.]